MENNQKNEEIIYIPISEIAPHPLQEEIYGETIIEDEFIASIKDKGIIVPIIITPLNSENHKSFQKEQSDPTFSDKKYICISGHRRIKGAISAGLEVVPAIIRKYENDDEILAALLISNFNREKNNTQRINEFLYYKQILCQLGKVHKSKGIYENTIFENDEFLTFVKNLKIAPEKPINAIEIIKDICGYSEREQRYMTVIFDDNYFVRVMNKFIELNVPIEEHNKFGEWWDKIRAEVQNGKIALKEAHDTIKKEINRIEEFYEKKNNKQNKASKEINNSQKNPKPKILEEIPTPQKQKGNKRNLLDFTSKSYIIIPKEEINLKDIEEENSFFGWSNGYYNFDGISYLYLNYQDTYFIFNFFSIIENISKDVYSKLMRGGYE